MAPRREHPLLRLGELLRRRLPRHPRARSSTTTRPSIVTNSWGDVEANESAGNVAAYEQVFLQGAMQGIGFMFSSGDNGDELANTGLKQADYPASDPCVTAVGGTSDAIGGRRHVRVPDRLGHREVQPDRRRQRLGPRPAFLYGAGGGVVRAVRPARPTRRASCRPSSAPAVRCPTSALDADPTTGMLVGETQTFPDGVHYGEYRIGGTSLASPLFAGMTAQA